MQPMTAVEEVKEYLETITKEKINEVLSRDLSLDQAAKEFKIWYLNASDEFYVNGTCEFKIGFFAVILSPTSGPSGTSP